MPPLSYAYFGIIITMALTYSDLRQQILARCNLENSNFISPAEMLFELSSSTAALHGLLVNKFEDYAVRESYVDLTSGDLIPLPSDFWKLLALDYACGDGYREVEKGSVSERNNMGKGDPPSGIYRITYVPRYSRPETLADALPDYAELQNWYEYVILDVCIKIMMKEESDYTGYALQKKEMEARINAEAANRDAGKAEYLPGWELYEDEFDDIPCYRESPLNVRYKLHDGNTIKLMKWRTYF